MSEEQDVHHTHPIAMAGLDELDKLFKEDRPKILESVFKSHFLPVLASTAPIDPKNKIRIDYWIDNIARTPNTPVDVLDDASGAVLFTVPAMFGRLDYKRNRGVALLDVIEIAQRQAKDYPVIAKSLLLNAVSEGFITNGMSDDQKAWIAILSRYDLLSSYMGFEAPAVEGVAAKPAEDYTPFSGEFDDL